MNPSARASPSHPSPAAGAVHVHTTLRCEAAASAAQPHEATGAVTAGTCAAGDGEQQLWNALQSELPGVGPAMLEPLLGELELHFDSEPQPAWEPAWQLDVQAADATGVAPRGAVVPATAAAQMQLADPVLQPQAGVYVLGKFRLEVRGSGELQLQVAGRESRSTPAVLRILALMLANAGKLVTHKSQECASGGTPRSVSFHQHTLRSMGLPLAIDADGAGAGVGAVPVFYPQGHGAPDASAMQVPASGPARRPAPAVVLQVPQPGRYTWGPLRLDVGDDGSLALRLDGETPAWTTTLSRLLALLLVNGARRVPVEATLAYCRIEKSSLRNPLSVLRKLGLPIDTTPLGHALVLDGHGPVYTPRTSAARNPDAAAAAATAVALALGKRKRRELPAGPTAQEPLLYFANAVDKPEDGWYRAHDVLLHLSAESSLVLPGGAVRTLEPACANVLAVLMRNPNSIVRFGDLERVTRMDRLALDQVLLQLLVLLRGARAMIVPHIGQGFQLVVAAGICPEVD